MSHDGSSGNEPINADSFLDIVASVVSVLIIMVVMTGLKIKSSPVPEAMAVGAIPVGRVVTSNLTEERTVQEEIRKTDKELQTLQQMASDRSRQCTELAQAMGARAERSQMLRQQVAITSQQADALNRSLAEANGAFATGQRELTEVENAPGPWVQVECYPTPLSQAVNKQEVHFRLHNGQVISVPIDSLIAKFRTDSHSKLERLRNEPEITETIGPENGFWLRYTLEREKSTPETLRRTGPGGFSAHLKRWTLVPESEENRG